MIVLIAHGNNVIVGQKIIIYHDQHGFERKHIKDAGLIQQDNKQQFKM
jgi:hypothetical protein